MQCRTTIGYQILTVYTLKNFKKTESTLLQ